jgi:hypothetical protein
MKRDRKEFEMSYMETDAIALATESHRRIGRGVRSPEIGIVGTKTFLGSRDATRGLWASDRMRVRVRMTFLALGSIIGYA